MTPAEFLATKGADLKTAGLYSWWIDASGAEYLTRGLGMPVTAGIIYAGQAGATRPRRCSKSRSTLWSRLSRNRLGNHRPSTVFWMPVGCVIAGVIGCVLIARLPSGSRPSESRTTRCGRSGPVIASAVGSVTLPDRL